MRHPNSHDSDENTSAQRSRLGDNFIADVGDTDVLVGRINKHRATAIGKGDRAYVRSIKTNRRVGCAGTGTEIDRASLAS